MELNYNFKVKSTTVKSALKGADSPVQSDIYIDKKYGWLDFEIKLNENSNYSLNSKLYLKEIFNNKTVFRTNTLSVLLTDVYINSDPYFYKLNIQSEEELSIEDLIIDLNIEDVVEYEGNFYTNNKFYLYNSETEFIFTQKVIDIDDCKIVYRPEYIEIETAPNTSILLETFVIKPQIINQYSFYLPSFYLKNNDNKSIQCIESDIKIFKSKLQTKSNEYLKYKLEKNSHNILKDFNLSFSLLESKDITYKISTHCFLCQDKISYYLITLDGSIIKSNKDNYTFKIIRNILVEYIDILPNIYKKLGNEYEDVRGKYINSYKEIDSSLNAFGLIYNSIDVLVPTFNYINNFKFTPIGFNSNPNLTKKSLKTDAYKIKVLPETKEDFKNYVHLDSVNYLIKSE